MELELILIGSIIITISLGIIVLFLIKFMIKLKKTHQNNINELELELNKKQSKAFQMGTNQTTGDYTEILGDFVLLSKYDQIITLSTTSKAPSLDLIGVNEESLDFLEIKKKGAKVTPGENKIRRLIEEKKVSYKVFDVEVPKGVTVEERNLKKLKTKI